MNGFNVNQIVRAKGNAHFVILGFPNIAGENFAQVKEINIATGELGRGEFALPIEVLRTAA